MSSRVSPPPHDLAAPNLVSLPAGADLHRIHDTQFDGATFNPCRGRPTRFAPIYRADASCIPFLYAGSSVEAAIFETIFHDVSPHAPFASVPVQEVSRRSHSIIVPRRDLVLASLRAPDLRRWRIAHGDLVSAPASEYGATARWAEAIHRQFSRIDGLVWTSNQCDPDSAYLFFADRVGADAFAITATRDGFDQGLLRDIHAAGARAGIVLTL